MSKKIFEAQIGSGPHRGHAAGDTDIEKKASQLASDVKYKVKQSMSGRTNLNPAQVAKAYLSQLAKSPAPPAIKALAKKKLTGSSSNSAPTTSSQNETYEFGNVDITEAVHDSLMFALQQTFIESSETEEKKYWIVVTDKKTGNTYRRRATRAKISELRSNPNISRVEITQYHPKDDDDKGGEKTAKVKSGKGLKNDGNLANNYPPYDKVTRGDVIAGAKGQDQMGGKKKVHKVDEEFLGEVSKKTNDKVTGKGVNNYKGGKNSVVKVFPKDVNEQMVDSEKDNLPQKKDPAQQAQNRKQLSVLQQFQRKEVQLNKQKMDAQRAGKVPVGSVQMNSYEPEGEDVQEVAPPGFEGTVKAMKKYPELSTGETPEGKEKNVYALAWYMKNKGYKSHKTASGKEKVVQKSHYEPEGEVVNEKDENIEAKFKKARTPYLLSKFRQEHPGSRQPKKVPGAKETEGQAANRRRADQAKRAARHGLTSREREETNARSRYYSARD